MRALALILLSLATFVTGLGAGAQLVRREAQAVAGRSLLAQQDATRRAVGASVDEAVEVLARETAAEPFILRRIVATPFERRGLLP